MSERIRFHLDEHIDPRIADALRRHGIDVTTTIEAGLRTRTDEAQWAFVYSERRVLVTRDSDFLRRAATGRDHAGIAFVSGTSAIGPTVRMLILLHEVLSPQEISGRVEYI